MRFCLTRFSFASAATAVACAGMSVAQEVRLEPALPESLPTVELESAAPAPKTADGKEATAEEKRLLSLGEALAATNQELEALREQHEQLKLQMEALGVAAIKGDERSLQQRLLKAGSDFRTTEKDRTELAEKSSRLAEAAAAFMAKPDEPTLKAGLEEAIKSVSAARKAVQSEAVALEASRVVSYKADLGLAVINAGRHSGVRMGTPLRVLRADKTIATGLVVDVRDRISGLLITGDATAAVRAGDSIKPELTQTSPKQ
jgi:hypothetical protein